MHSLPREERCALERVIQKIRSLDANKGEARDHQLENAPSESSFSVSTMDYLKRHNLYQ